VAYLHQVGLSAGKRESMARGHPSGPCALQHGSFRPTRLSSCEHHRDQSSAGTPQGALQVHHGENAGTRRLRRGPAQRGLQSSLSAAPFRRSTAQ